MKQRKRKKMEEHKPPDVCPDLFDHGLDQDLCDEGVDTHGPVSPPEWNLEGLSFQLFQICSFFMYVIYLHNLSDAALELFLPLLVLYAPELSTFTAQKLKDLLGIGQHTFQKYAVCPKCASLKSFADLQLDPVCRFDPFGSGKPCNTELGTRARSLLGAFGHVQPHKTFAYSGICTQLKRMLARPGFANKLELWRKRRMPSGTLADVYDGSVWRDFMAYQGSPFLSLPGNLALQLNYGMI
jgi:hypothetical protein